MLEWRDVPGYEGRYKVSSKGDLISIINGVEKILKGSISNVGYRQYTLSWKKKYNVYCGHQLVAMAFLGHSPNSKAGYVVDHINNIKTDNRVENLQLLSNRENSCKDRNTTSMFGARKRGNKFAAVVWTWCGDEFLGEFKTELEAHKAAVKYIEENKIERVLKKHF